LKILLPFVGMLAIAITGCSGSASNPVSPTIPTLQGPASLRSDSLRTDNLRSSSLRLEKPASVRALSLRSDSLRPSSVRLLGTNKSI
jgi:hypothetical protein